MEELNAQLQVVSTLFCTVQSCFYFLLTPHLQAEYSRMIDTSTLLAILSDYDLSHESQLKSAREILDSISENAKADEETGFDASAASGAGFLGDGAGTENGEDESSSARSMPGWASTRDNTSLSHDMSSLDLEGLDFSSNGNEAESPHRTYPSELDGWDEASNERQLVEIFPTLKPFDIKWALTKNKGDAGKALEDLLTQSFMEESGTRLKGIDAFSETDVPSRPRKSKGKKKKLRLGDELVGSPSEKSPIQSKWDAGRQDLEFLSEKTDMPMLQMGSLYHKNGASVRATIAAIIEAHEAMNLESDDPNIQIETYQLRQDFPAIPMSHLEALVQITHPNTDDARDLAKALLTPNTNGNKTPFQISFRHAPISLDSEPTKPKPHSHNAVNPNLPLNATSASLTASSLTQARNTAFTQAHAAYRKGKSDHLMGSAAAYYSQIGRDLDARAKSAQSAAADSLVSAQSSRTELDLHGVNVKDAVRISRERVTNWWHELGESRINGRGVGGGYRIVTGLGRHSEGGRGKLGPAVGKMLLKEGWKVEVGSGVLLVTGVATKR